jgi:hypothetical protein
MSELTLQLARRIEPRRLGLWLAAIWLTFAVVGLMVHQGHGSWTLQAFNLEDSNLDKRLSMPASFTALLLLCAAGMAFALANVDRSRRRTKWLLAGYAFVAFGLEELLGVHSWLQSRGVPFGVAYVPLLLAGLAALLGTLRIFHRQPRSQAVFGAALVLWLAGGALDNPAVGHSATAEVVEMAAAVMFGLALLARLRYLARQYYPLNEPDTRLTPDEIAAEAVGRVRLRPIAVGLALVTAAFAIQYVLLHSGNYHRSEKIPILDLNNEQTLWATMQGSLIFAVGGLALVMSRLAVTRAEMRRWWTALGFVLLILGADEIIAIHDRFQDATGNPGQIVLIPVAIVGVVAWLKLLGEFSENETVRKLWIAGASLWFFSQASDVLLNSTFRWTITPEEVAETSGSSLWLLAVLCWMRSVLPLELSLRPPEDDAALAPLTIVRDVGPAAEARETTATG